MRKKKIIRGQSSKRFDTSEKVDDDSVNAKMVHEHGVEPRKTHQESGADMVDHRTTARTAKRAIALIRIDGIDDEEAPPVEPVVLLLLLVLVVLLFVGVKSSGSGTPLWN